MTKFTLNIEIDLAGIKSLTNAQMSVAMLQVDPDSQYLVVGVLTNPTQKITISWDDSVYVYTSGSPLQGYKTLEINSWKQASSGNLYSFNGSLITDRGSGQVPQGSVQIENKNNSSNPITTGLAKYFTVNDQKLPLAIMTASSLLYNGLGTFPISNNFWLTALSNSSQGQVIPRQVIPMLMPMALAAQPGLLLKFSDANAVQQVRYDDQNNQFIQS
ncbi:hypothetical protein [Microcystis aeruginosa]|jgi:hypothetical protein|uniref:hypothetical protein n=1 Tax=Microcystis aeruginosa TaxID=1126 RepID=UPI0011EA7575|nr:hypothetical protein [Microcystis aeruginosa]